MSSDEDDFFDKLDEESKSESYDSSSDSVAVNLNLKNDPPTNVLTFGKNFRDLVNPSAISNENSIKKAEVKAEIPIIRENQQIKKPEIENRDFTPIEKKINIESEEDFSSIDSKPSVKGRPNSKFSFNLPVKIETSNTFKKLPSMKYQDNNDSSSSNSDSKRLKKSNNSKQEIKKITPNLIEDKVMEKNNIPRPVGIISREEGKTGKNINPELPNQNNNRNEIKGEIKVNLGINQNIEGKEIKAKNKSFNPGLVNQDNEIKEIKAENKSFNPALGIQNNEKKEIKAESKSFNPGLINQNNERKEIKAENKSFNPELANKNNEIKAEKNISPVLINQNHEKIEIKAEKNISPVFSINQNKERNEIKPEKNINPIFVPDKELKVPDIILTNSNLASAKVPENDKFERSKMVEIDNKNIISLDRSSSENFSESVYDYNEDLRVSLDSKPNEVPELANKPQILIEKKEPEPYNPIKHSEENTWAVPTQKKIEKIPSKNPEKNPEINPEKNPEKTPEKNLKKNPEKNSLNDNISYSISSQVDPEVNLNSSSQNMISLEEEKRMIEVDIKLPESYKETQELFYNSKLLSFSQIVNNIKSSPEVENNLWRKKSCFNPFCGCFSSSEELPQSAEQDVFKLISLGLASYDNNQQFHKDLFMSMYQRLSGKTQFLNTPQVWKELGFSSENYKTNEISKVGILVTVTHLLYLYEYCPSILMKLTAAAFGIKKFVMIDAIHTLMENSLTLLRQKTLNDIILRERKDPIITFLEFHGGVILLWLDIYNNALNLQESYKQIFLKANNNKEVLLQVYKNESNRAN